MSVTPEVAGKVIPPLRRPKRADSSNERESATNLLDDDGSPNCVHSLVKEERGLGGEINLRSGSLIFKACCGRWKVLGTHAPKSGSHHEDCSQRPL
jgi:hypothetical protein